MSEAAQCLQEQPDRLNLYGKQQVMKCQTQARRMSVGDQANVQGRALKAGDFGMIKDEPQPGPGALSHSTFHYFPLSLNTMHIPRANFLPTSSIRMHKDMHHTV